MSYQKFFITILVKKENIENNEGFKRDNLDLLGWNLNAYDYEFNGAITFAVNNIEGNADDILAAFVDGEVRGIAERLYFPYGDKYIYIMQVYSNEVEGEELLFKLYDSLSGEIYEYVESVVFENDMIIGDGFATFNLEQTVVNQLPIESALSQAYPNPFNPTTNIEYSVLEEGYANILVYDLQGRVVQELVNEYKDQGDYKIVWNAVNVPSGVYFIQMNINCFVSTQKVMLIK